MNPTDVQSHLAGADYPATGEELAALAEDNGAPGALVERLRELGDAELDGPDDVMAELDLRELDEEL
ncbi:MAG TPA: DUF2795 domain-containing protein [Gaiellaceae bacterium]|nr:DUF2795 domain-containing protein [Gaiellaceae bacterium]